MTDCIFCKIIKGDIPSSKFWEDDKHVAFLDIFPIKKGHTLLVPKKHDNYVFDLEDNEIANLFKAAKSVAKVLKKAFNPKSGKIGIVVYGLDATHAHIHLVPIDKPGDLDFKRKKPASKEELNKILIKLQSNNN